MGGASRASGGKYWSYTDAPFSDTLCLRLPGSRYRVPAGGPNTAALFFLADSPPPARRTIFYIDGFNLYYGAVKDTPYKWLNLEAFCRRLHPADSLVKVRYFTSLVVGATQPNQHRFWRALSTTPIVEITQGKFKNGTVECVHRECTFKGNRRFQKPQEKRTDVAIAVAMVDDAHQDRCDNLVLISGDSDLVPAVNLVRTNFPKKTVFVYAPTRGEEEDRRASELIKAAHIGRQLATKHLSDCQFPNEITDRYGRLTRKPESWP